MNLKGYLSLCACIMACTFFSCDEKEENRISPLGITAQPKEESADYDLPQIQESGELIAVTLSGPDTYYEYKGQGCGLQFEMAENFANSIGTRLRMETVRDTAELLRRMESGEADLVALEMPPASLLPETGLQSAGAWAMPSDTTARGRKQWLVRQNAPLLAEALDKWYKPEMRKALIRRDRLRFVPGGGVKRRVRAPIQNRSKGIISPYDTDFIRHSRGIGWDWRLMAAQCYQESCFDPKARSWAGACGLMQIMPATADHLGLPRASIYDPEHNVRAAAEYLRELSGYFRSVHNQAERQLFVLAAYNGGYFHVQDAMALARKNGRNPHRWKDVAYYILALEKLEFYNDPVVRYGYMRGSETVGYVDRIRQRYAQYRGVPYGGASVKGWDGNQGTSGYSSPFTPRKAKRKHRFHI